jgi:dihydroorotate dehydrogenase
MKVKTKRGMEFTNPIGLSAGFDSTGISIDSLFDLGLGFIEVGSVTPD